MPLPQKWLPVTSIKAMIGRDSPPDLREEVEEILRLIIEECPDAVAKKRGEGAGWVFAPAMLTDQSPPRNLINLWVNSEAVRLNFDGRADAPRPKFKKTELPTYRTLLRANYSKVLAAHGLAPTPAPFRSSAPTPPLSGLKSDSDGPRFLPSIQPPATANAKPDETASRAKTFFGEQPYQKKAREALPHLVALAEAQDTIFYKALARRLSMPNHRNLNYVLGSIGQTLIELGMGWREKIPPIQSLVLNKVTKLPGEGVGFFMDTAHYTDLSMAEQRVVVEDIHRAVWSYPRWQEVLAALSLHPIPPQSVEPTKSQGGGFGSVETNALVEKAAVDLVTSIFKKRGYSIQTREHEHLGYDLDATTASGEVLHLEVKGTGGEDVRFIITANEVRCANYDPAFRLCVVTQARSITPKLHEFTASELTNHFELVPLTFMASVKRSG